MKNDPGWAAFAEHLRLVMDEERVGPTELSDRLAAEFPAAVVAKWRYGYLQPPLAAVPQIARALDREPSEFAHVLGVLPQVRGSAADLTRRLMEMDQRLARIAPQYQRARTDSAVQSLWDTLQRHPDWAVLLSPAREGPEGFDVLEAIRVAFVPRDGSDGTRAEVERVFGSELRMLQATPSNARLVVDALSRHPRYTVPILNRPRSPVATPSSRMPALTVLATTVRSWVPYVAAHIADALGYGLLSSRDLAAIAFDEPLAETSSPQRAEFAAALISHPPAGYVTYHFEAVSAYASDTLERLEHLRHSDQHILWLSEDDATLEHAARHRQHDRTDIPAEARVPWRQDLEVIARYRDEITTLLSSRPRQTIIRPIEMPEGCTPAQVPFELRGPAVLRSLDVAADTLAEMRERGWIAQTDLVDHAVAVRRLAAREGDRRD